MSDKIVERFARSPLGRKLESEQQAEDLAQRRDWMAQRVRLRADVERQRPLVADALTAAEARERALEAELLLAHAARLEAARRVMSASLAFEAQDGGLVRQLRATADLRIRECRSRLLVRGEAARAATRATGPHPGLLDRATGTYPEFWSSNAAENARVMQAVGAACLRLDALELEALDDAELRGQLAAIDASVPTATDAVTTPQRPDLTPGEARELGWRLQKEQEARR
ncbi:MAG: hypothetical protein Q7W02_02450 [Candidatus Rokubacteria bacterium]|nr:hypothetical protein [Candidatus Rokubacteria bacterium]